MTSFLAKVSAAIGKGLAATVGRFFCYIIFLMPWPVKRAMGWWIGWLWFDVFRIRRRLVVENIAACFPDWDQKRVVAVGRESLQNTGITVIDFFDLAFMTPQQLKERVTFEGEEHLRSALAQGKGMLLLGAHMANGDFGISALAATGVPTYLISKRFSNKWLDEVWFRIRGRFGTQFISPRDSSFNILKALKKNAVVIFVLDQFMGPPLGVKTTFFGRPTGTAMGLALFAERTGAPVVPCHAERVKKGHYVVKFSKAIPFEEQGDKKVTLQYMTQKYTDKIEEMVRGCPGQWMWLHRRWKPFNEKPDSTS